MKIIFSRKGFDSSCGGVASPIYNGQLVSLPIPEPMRPPADGGARTYGAIRSPLGPLGPIVGGLTGGSITPRTPAHLDPDLDAASVARLPGWRPCFGQTGAAERHLQNAGIGPGDVFLFFGWFREVTQVAGRFQYRSGAPDLHVCFGWLQIDRRWNVARPSTLPAWTAGHPHHKAALYKPLDSIYTSTPKLRLPGCAGPAAHRSGGGVLSQFKPERCLTAAGHTRIYWKLPAWFQPTASGSALTYHANPARWQKKHGGTLLKTVCQGQEFVLDCNRYPQAISWLANLLT